MHKDATGRPIARGAYIAYAVGVGSGGGIKFGRVVKLKEKDVEFNRYDPSVPGNYTKVTETHYSVQIISAERQWKIPPGGKYDDGKHEWCVQGKKDDAKLARVQSIERLDRVVVLEPDQMHPEAREVIDKEMHERGST